MNEVLESVSLRGTLAEHEPPFTGHRVVSRYTQTISAPPERVFPLICPVRETEWADGWVGRPVYAVSGLAEADGVYATDHEGEEEPTIWMITRRDPATYETEFATFVPGRQVTRLTIAIRPAPLGSSHVFITYVRTGISEKGNAAVARAGQPQIFIAAMKEWERAMNYFLATGHCLQAGPGSTSHP